jgi:hypothetical protein
MLPGRHLKTKCLSADRRRDERLILESWKREIEIDSEIVDPQGHLTRGVIAVKTLTGLRKVELVDVQMRMRSIVES